MKVRSKRGAVLGLVAACAFVLVLIVVAFFGISMFLGGGREIHNATDAGALHLGKQVFTNESFKVKKPNSQFQDVADKNGEFGLANINAVWGRALLAQANAEAMESQGLGGAGRQNADLLFDQAERISNELAGKLNDRVKKFPVFEELAGQNTLRMIGLGLQLKAADEADSWQTSLMDRGKESNLEVPSPEILPSENSYRALALRNNRIPGYTPLRVGGKVFCFVPFADKERNHLVSLTEFQANTKAAKALDGPEWGEPVPNAFSCKGKCADSLRLSHEAVSCVLANPQKLYKLSMPHTFLKIKLADNQAEWLFNPPDPRLDGVNVGLVKKQSGYANRVDPTSKSGGGGSAVDGRLNGDLVPLGSEYGAKPSLDSALFGTDLLRGNKAKIEQVLVQRINEMLSEPGKTFDKNDLHRLLKQEATGVALQAGGEQEYYIYSPDGKNVEVQRKQLALASAPWLFSMVGNPADGLNSENYCKLTSDLPLPPGIVNVIPLPGAAIVVPPFGRYSVEIEEDWRPGSGYGGCLGELNVAHKSTVFLWGVAIIPAAPGAGLIERIFGF